MLKTIFLWVFATLILLQLIQIKIPETPINISKTVEIEAPKNMMALFKKSCYDCHSYETKIPWYGHIAPISWEVKGHIKDGRKWLNFQTWNIYDEEKKQKFYKGIVKTISYRMPIPNYLYMHEEARLSKGERDAIKLWAQSHIKNED